MSLTWPLPLLWGSHSMRLFQLSRNPLLLHSLGCSEGHRSSGTSTLRSTTLSLLMESLSTPYSHSCLQGQSSTSPWSYPQIISKKLSFHRPHQAIGNALLVFPTLRRVLAVVHSVRQTLIPSMTVDRSLKIGKKIVSFQFVYRTVIDFRPLSRPVYQVV